MTIAERRTEDDASVPSDTSAHDRTLFTAIETLADIPGLADRLHDALAGECTLLFGAQIGARLARAGLSRSDAERVHRVMGALAAATSWWPLARQRVQSPADLAALAMPLLARRDHEELHVAVVDGRNGLLALRQVYVGDGNRDERSHCGVASTRLRPWWRWLCAGVQPSQWRSGTLGRGCAPDGGGRSGGSPPRP